MKGKDDYFMKSKDTVNSKWIDLIQMTQYNFIKKDEEVL